MSDAAAISALATLHRLAACDHVYLTFNQHRSCYLSVHNWWHDNADDPTAYEGWIGGEATFREADRRCEMYEAHFYPITPIGFYKLLHYNLEALLAKVNEILKKELGE